MGFFMGFTLGPRRRPPSLRRPPGLPCNATKFGLKKEHFGVFHHFGAFALKVGPQKTPKGPKIPQKTPKSPQNPIDFPPSPTPQIPPSPKFTIFNQIWAFLPQILGSPPSPPPPPSDGIPKDPKKPQFHPKMLTCPPRFAPAAPAAPHPNGCAPTSPPNLGEKRANLGKKGEKWGI